MNAAGGTLRRIEQALAVLRPLHLQVRDDSHLHAGHAGARDGGGHYHLDIVSEQFAGRTAVARHRQVYAALGSLMGHSIHALAIQAWAPGERPVTASPSTTLSAKED